MLEDTPGVEGYSKGGWGEQGKRGGKKMEVGQVEGKGKKMRRERAWDTGEMGVILFLGGLFTGRVVNCDPKPMEIWV